ncbi:MAG: M24 family metallopeptidase [Chitinophagaceae bacterium]|nr:MAG: M24 family metallopeptidase [Chitinophagaceae bacterium]
MFKKEVYIKRRQRLKELVGNGMILLLGNDESSMNYKDNCYAFRQDSTFLYFFGIDRPGLTAVLDIDTDKEIVFGNDISVEDIIWTGPLESLADQANRAGIREVRPLGDIEKMIDKIRSKESFIHFLPPYRPENKQKLNSWIHIPLEKVNESASVLLIRSVVALRSVKDAEEIEEIEKAINVTIDMQKKAGNLAREGISETAIAGDLHGMALSACGDLSFPTILTVNGQILHNHFQGNILKSGQMILCDCGAESSMHYAGDLTRTFPVDSTFTTKQKEIYHIVLMAHEAAAGALKAGILFKDIHVLACEKLAEGLKDIGLMKGDIKEAVVEGVHAMFFQCGLGHMLGLDAHDMEDLGEQYVGYTDQLQKSTQFGLKSLRLGKAIEPGFVLTVEPGIYFIPELIDWWKGEKRFPDFINYNELERYKNFGGIRIEEDFLITETGSRLLGKYLPRTAEAVESIKVGF